MQICAPCCPARAVLSKSAGDRLRLPDFLLGLIDGPARPGWSAVEGLDLLNTSHDAANQDPHVLAIR